MVRTNMVRPMVVALCAFIVCVSCTPHRQPQKSVMVNAERKLKYFSKVEVELPCDVEFVQSSTPCVKVRGDKDAVDNIVFVNSDDKLVVTSKLQTRIFMNSVNSEGLAIKIFSPDLTDVSLKSSGAFRATGLVDTDCLNVQLTGSGSVVFDRIVCDNISVSLGGSGEIRIDSVRGVNSSVSLLGSGSVRIDQHKFKRCDLRLLGVGSIESDFADCEKVSCELLGVGKLTLRGNVKSFEQKKRGTGQINTDNLVVGR